MSIAVGQVLVRFFEGRNTSNLNDAENTRRICNVRFPLEIAANLKTAESQHYGTLVYTLVRKEPQWKPYE
jgi:hypothetical protein